MKFTSRSAAGTPSGIAYLLLLTAFISLGLFVASLAIGSVWAVAFGVGLIACMAGSVAGFRAQSAKLSQSSAHSEDPSIFSIPLRQEDVDRYRQNYRGENIARDENVAPARPMTVVPGHNSARRARTEHVGPALLSA